MKINKIFNGIELKKLIKIAGYQGKESVHTRAMQKFISLIKNEFSISFIEDITSNNKKASDLISQTQNGEIDISYLFTSYFTSIIPELLYLDLPFYFNSKEEAFNDLNKNLKPMINDELKNKHNLFLLGFWDNGTRHISSSKKFIHTPKDCNEQIIRTTPNQLHIDTFKSFGFIPKPLDVLDFKKALLIGDLDAQENPITNFYQFKVYKKQKFFKKTSHVYGFCLFLINKNYFQKLSDNETKLLIKSANTTNSFQKKLAHEEEQKLFKKIKSENVKISNISKKNKSEFKKISEPFHIEFFKKFKTLNF